MQSVFSISNMAYNADTLSDLVYNPYLSLT